MITLKNISKIYNQNLPSETPALRDISLEIKQSEFIALTGSSGSGKSTLMHILGMLDRPTAGSYFFKNTQTSTISRTEQSILRNKHIGFIFQRFHLLPGLTAQDNIALPLLYQGVSEKIAREKASKILKNLELSERISHLPHELSGGQQQRVAIGRALITNPDILIGDEPTGALDSKTSTEIMKLLQKIHREDKKTLLIVTHDHKVAQQAERILEMRDGKLL